MEFIARIVHLVPTSLNDIFPQKIFEKIKSHETNNVPIIGENPLHNPNRLPWHKKFDSAFPHTKEYRIVRAICENDLKEVETCLEEGIGINQAIDTKKGLTPLNLASLFSRPLMIKYLVMRGADLESRDKFGNTPLMNSVATWQFDNIQILVESGSSIKSKDLHGRNSVDRARDKGLGSIQNFLEREASKNDLKKDFPKFKLKLEFERSVGEDSLEKKWMDEKFFVSKGYRYPYNSLKGTYLINLISFDY